MVEIRLFSRSIRAMSLGLR